MSVYVSAIFLPERHHRQISPLNRSDHLAETIILFSVVHEEKKETHRKHKQIENKPDKQELLSLRAEFRLPSTHCEEPDTFLSCL